MLVNCLNVLKNNLYYSFLVALSLQEEQQKQQSSELEWEDYKKEKLGISNGLTE